MHLNEREKNISLHHFFLSVVTRNLAKFSYNYKVQECLIDSAYFGKRVVSLGQLLTKVANFID